MANQTDRESNIRVAELPEPEQELTPEEQKGVAGAGFAIGGRHERQKPNSLLDKTDK